MLCRSFISILFILIFSFSAEARKLNEVELFNRCFAHLTGKQAALNNPFYIKVKSGKARAAEVCKEILSLARLNRGTLSNQSYEAVNVLNNLHKLHMNFFYDAAIPLNDSYQYDMFDEQSIALYYTKALFDPRFSADQILQGNKMYTGIRSQGAGREGHFSRKPLTDIKFGRGNLAVRNIAAVEAGYLLGIKEATSPTYDYKNASYVNLRSHSSHGGGLLGDRMYILRTLPLRKAADGALKMERKWPVAIYRDLLCRELPVVRLADGQPYKHKDAEASFRKADGCIQCHVSMDRLAGGVRTITRVSTDREHRVFFNVQLKPSKSKAKELWPLKSDKDYLKRPNDGVLYFRSYNGELINKKFSSLEGLGKIIRESNDFYACMAKKYYQYFTGISASLADINDPFSSVQLDTNQMYHRENVISLAEELKRSKDPQKIIFKILSSNYYRTENFNP